MKLASGYTFKYEEMKRRGIRIGIGTDGCSSSNNLDMVVAMKLASFLGKAWRFDSTACKADGKPLDGTSADGENRPQHGTSLPITIETSAIEIAGIPCNPISATDELPSEINSKLASIKQAGDSAGAIVQCTVRNVPAGLGEPVFDKLEAELAKAVLSIGSVKGIAFGAGFQLARMSGSEANAVDKNHHGGIAGGISDGKDIVFQAVIKPVPSIAQEQIMETASGERISHAIAGRHDVCLYRRIMPVIDAMVAIVLADMMLRQGTAQILKV